MSSKMNIIERIDEIRANSISDAEFKKLWGISIDEHIKEMMEFVRKYDAKDGFKH